MSKLLIKKVLLFLFVVVFSLSQKTIAQSDVKNVQKPNILLIISDDLNTRIGPYMEINKHTPHLDRLADEGVRFTRTYCQYPLCGPSRASFMSGLYSETNGVMNNNDKPGSYRVETPSLAKHPSMAGFFREQGYYTARVSKIYHMGVPGGIERGAPGGDEPDSWDYAYNVLAPETLSQGKLELLSPGNLHYGSNFSRMILPNDLEDTQADYLAANQAIAILENRAGKIPENGRNKQKLKNDAPFFLAVGFVRPHVPLIAPENCFEPYPEDEVQLPPVVVNDNVPEQALRRQNSKTQKMDELQKRQTISAYMASVRFMDQQVGRLLDALDRLKIREETIVIFISDHGYNLGEHDCWSKVSLWEGSVRVPMIISDPNNKSNNGTSDKSITELIDLYPTLAELSGLSEKQPKILQGNSLAGLISGKNSSLKKTVAYTITGGKGATIRTDRWRYTRWGEEIDTGNEELYDHKNDPEEHFNLVQTTDKQNILIELRKSFEQARKKARMEISVN
ncbi:MAG: sulfatase [Prolixibacteraceae bacterium]|jgi:iduronate 2-sulfatase|nr:sulfatase [Prolixibacteraceae bacterium]MBT6765374.1 sulfatase [Prolixibacteraceae bacterium]MBT7000276.1 sulfatase [Prolixibacteraceae bacterium]MBT7394092.1 sulfatase [Prolixibacteraceae bacterium]